MRDVARFGWQRVGDDHVLGRGVALIDVVESVGDLVAGHKVATIVALGKIEVPRAGDHRAAVSGVVIGRIGIIGCGNDRCVGQGCPCRYCIRDEDVEVEVAVVAVVARAGHPSQIPDHLVALRGGRWIGGDEGDASRQRVRHDRIQRCAVAVVLVVQPVRRLRALDELAVVDRFGEIDVRCGRGDRLHVGVAVALQTGRARFDCGGGHYHGVGQRGSHRRPLRYAHGQVKIAIVSRVVLTGHRPQVPGYLLALHRRRDVPGVGDVIDLGGQRVGDDHVFAGAVAVVPVVYPVRQITAGAGAPFVARLGHPHIVGGGEDGDREVGAIVGVVALRVAGGDLGGVGQHIVRHHRVADQRGDVEIAVPIGRYRPQIPGDDVARDVRGEQVVGVIGEVGGVVGGEIGHRDRQSVGEHHVSGGRVALVPDGELVGVRRPGQFLARVLGFGDVHIPRAGLHLVGGCVGIVGVIGLGAAGAGLDRVGQHRARRHRIRDVNGEIEVLVAAGGEGVAGPDHLVAHHLGREGVVVALMGHVGGRKGQGVGDAHIGRGAVTVVLDEDAVLDVSPRQGRAAVEVLIDVQIARGRDGRLGVDVGVVVIVALAHAADGIKRVGHQVPGDERAG